MPTTTPKIGLQKPIPNVDTNWGVTVNTSLDILDEAILAPNLLGSGTITIFDDGSGSITVSGASTTNLANLPTASGSLSAGDIWVDVADNYALRITPA